MLESKDFSLQNNIIDTPDFYINNLNKQFTTIFL